MQLFWSEGGGKGATYIFQVTSIWGCGKDYYVLTKAYSFVF